METKSSRPPRRGTPVFVMDRYLESACARHCRSASIRRAGEEQRKTYRRTMRHLGIALFLATILLSACSTTGSSGSTSTSARAAHSGSLNVTPCNYAQAWNDNPAQFTEFGTLARFARMAANSSLRNEGQQLASAVADHTMAVVNEVTSHILATCRQLRLVRTTPTSSRPSA